ncbi:MAG: hypothetical protein ACLFWF_04385 [Alphaproteobacteria bacterium]
MNPFARPEGLLWLVAGFLLWSSAFLMSYGAHALGCEYGWDRLSLGPVSALRLVLIGILLVHAAAFFILLALIRRLGRQSVYGGEGLIGRLSFRLAAAALLATAWTGLPVFAWPVCR